MPLPLSIPRTAPDGRQAFVDTDVLDIARRINEGDGTVGWAGDPGMWLEFDVNRNEFVVCRYDPATGAEADMCRWAPPLNVGLLVKLRDGDTHRAGNDPVGRMLAAEAQRERDEEDYFALYVDEEVTPRLVHALDKGGVDMGRPKRIWFPGQ